MRRAARVKDAHHGPVAFADMNDIADIGMFMSILFSLRLKGPSLAEVPVLAAWYERVRRRPAAGRVAAEIAAADRELSPALNY